MWPLAVPVGQHGVGVERRARPRALAVRGRRRGGTTQASVDVVLCWRTGLAAGLARRLHQGHGHVTYDLKSCGAAWRLGHGNGDAPCSCRGFWEARVAAWPYGRRGVRGGVSTGFNRVQLVLSWFTGGQLDMAQCMERDRERLGFKTTRMTCPVHTFCDVASMWYCNMQAIYYDLADSKRLDMWPTWPGQVPWGHSHKA
eukprot:363762-Chlamydomonas_euryale.AAC.3